MWFGHSTLALLVVYRQYFKIDNGPAVGGTIGTATEVQTTTLSGSVGTTLGIPTVITASNEPVFTSVGISPVITKSASSGSASGGPATSAHATPVAAPGGVSSNASASLVLGLGLGVPLLIASGAIAWFSLRSRRWRQCAQKGAHDTTAELYHKPTIAHTEH
jgi:hypothetical protein